MASFNIITVVGNLGRDPELRYTPANQAVTNFSIATNHKRGDQEETLWFKVTTWGKQAENAAKYLTKGSPVFVQGRLGMEFWTDNEGNQRHTLTVNADQCNFLSSGSAGANRDGGEHTGGENSGAFLDDSQPTLNQAAPTSAATVSDDDVPFDTN